MEKQQQKLQWQFIRKFLKFWLPKIGKVFYTFENKLNSNQNNISGTSTSFDDSFNGEALDSMQEISTSFDDSFDGEVIDSTQFGTSFEDSDSVRKESCTNYNSKSKNELNILNEKKVEIIPSRDLFYILYMLDEWELWEERLNEYPKEFEEENKMKWKQHLADINEKNKRRLCQVIDRKLYSKKGEVVNKEKINFGFNSGFLNKIKQSSPRKRQISANSKNIFKRINRKINRKINKEDFYGSNENPLTEEECVKYEKEYVRYI